MAREHAQTREFLNGESLLNLYQGWKGCEGNSLESDRSWWVVRAALRLESKLGVGRTWAGVMLLAGHSDPGG